MAHPVTDVRLTNYRFAPLTPDRWDDLVVVFGRGRGVCSQCWCMYWRAPRKEFEAALGDRNKRAFKARVEAGPPPGLLAYAGDEPVGWVQVGPRADVPQWNGARRLSAPGPGVSADDPGVWGISCFAVRVGWRGKGVATALLDAAIDWARSNGARLVEACPVAAETKRQNISLYHGVASTFARAGFVEVARRRPDRPLMRLVFPGDETG